MHSFEVHSNESACIKKVRIGLEQVLSYIFVSQIIVLRVMEARTKYAYILWKIPPTFVMTQASEMKNYGKVNMYSITRNVCAGSWTRNIKRTI